MRLVKILEVAIMLFAAESRIDIEYQVIDLFTGEHTQPAHTAINPNRLIPVLEDGDFRLTECSAILKYLAEKTGSKAYPADLRKRARINERMDWLNTQFYRDYGYGLVYPQLFPNLKRPTEEQHAGTISWGKEKAAGWLQILDRNLIGQSNGFRRPGYAISADPGFLYSRWGYVFSCNVPWAIERNLKRSVPEIENGFRDGSAAFADYIVLLGFFRRF